MSMPRIHAFRDISPGPPRAAVRRFHLPHVGLNIAPYWSLFVALGIELGNGAYAWLQDHRSNRRMRSRIFARALGGYPKRLLDVSVALTALVLLSPIMLIVAVLLKFTMGGNVIFSHQRVGFNGVSFRCLKFRSMVVNADDVLERHLRDNTEAAREWRETQKLKDDPRVGVLGRLLRRSSLDELPQLFNVLRGEMSCVGPRPIVAAELERYGRHAHEYLRAKPGMTGMWQVSGRNLLSYRNRVALDCVYVRKWSLWLDVAVMFMTVPAVLNFEQTA